MGKLQRPRINQALSNNGGGVQVKRIGAVDVVNDLNWIVSNKPLARKETPIIKLVEYQQTISGLEQSINFWAQQAAEVAANKSSRINPYQDLYVARPTENSYIFPFYNPYHHTITNNWGSNQGPIGEFINNTLAQVAKVTSPTAGIEAPKAWEGTTAASYSFTFDLLNTVPDSIQDNQYLIEALISANLSDRINSVAAFPPVLYTVEIPGVRKCPAAIISNLTVENVGQINKMADGKNVPDAYRVMIQIMELIVESRNIFDATSKVTAIVEDPNETATGGLTEGTATINKDTAKTLLDKGKNKVTEFSNTLFGE